MTSILLFLLITIKSGASSRYTQLSIIDSSINNFLLEEERLWNDINGQTNRPNTQNATLSKLFDYFSRHLDQLNTGNVQIVNTVNRQLGEYINEINQTQKSATRWLFERKYEQAQSRCEEIITQIPPEISKIFDVTKNRDFLNYIRDNSDFCQTTKRIVSPGVEELNLQNVVMDFYTTVAEALIKGYMTAQMAYMVLAVKATR